MFAPYTNGKETDSGWCFNTLANNFLLPKDRLVFSHGAAQIYYSLFISLKDKTKKWLMTVEAN